MAEQGEPQMTQEQLNEALYNACGLGNDLARAEELLGFILQIWCNPRQDGFGTSTRGNGMTLLAILRRVKDWPFHDGICETLFLDELGDYKIITSF